MTALPVTALPHPMRVAEMRSRKPITFELRADPAGLVRLAAALGITRVEKLVFRGALLPVGRRDLTLEADMQATVVQPCIVSLAPVVTRITEKVLRRYVEDYAAPEGDEVEMPEDDSVEPLPQVIDIGAVLQEALALTLPLYPRAAGAALGEFVHAPPGAAPLRAVDLHPFAGLAALAQKPAGDAKVDAAEDDAAEDDGGKS